jgi:hypothetical protein
MRNLVGDVVADFVEIGQLRQVSDEGADEVSDEVPDEE